MNIPPAARSVHLMDESDILLPESERILGKSFDSPTTHHPRISVVMTVDTACTAYAELINPSRMDAPTVPNR